jgi:hypothetical protein
VWLPVVRYCESDTVFVESLRVSSVMILRGFHYEDGSYFGILLAGWNMRTN